MSFMKRLINFGLKKVTAMAVLVAMLVPEFTISYADGERNIRTDEPIVNGSQIKINGGIDSGEQGNLFMKVTRQENEIYKAQCQ